MPLPLARCAFSRSSGGTSTVIFRAVSITAQYTIRDTSIEYGPILGAAAAAHYKDTAGPLTLNGDLPKLADMEVHLNSEKEALLAQIATQRGLKTDELAELVLSRYLEDDARFVEAVNLGLAAADRGEFVEHGEVWANVEKILQS